MDIEKIKAAMRTRPKTVTKKLRSVSMGSTLVNLAISGDVNCGLVEGQIMLFVGDTNSGKTWLGMACLAEASIDPDFDDYRLIYDAPENGALMDREFYFGKKLMERLEPPRIVKGEHIHSETIEDFFFNIDDAGKKGTPFIWVLDSVDALTSNQDEKKFDERKIANRKKKQAKGDYGMDKPKIISRDIRRTMKILEKTGSILVIINQTRDNVDAGMFESKKTRSGGWALEFYASVVVWSSVMGHITKQVRGKKRELGTNCKVRVKRTRVTGRQRVVEIPIYHSFGVDDIGSCIDYLLDEGAWKKGKGDGDDDEGGRNIVATGMGPKIVGTREKLIQEIEERGLQQDLRDLVQQTWDEIEDACRILRQNPYRSE